MPPKNLHELRASGLPVAGVPNFKCQKCKRSVYQFAGRKRVHRGWVCAACVVSVPTTEKETAASSVR